jgi:GTPase Era involved in 16S rRNA processing
LYTPLKCYKSLCPQNCCPTIDTPGFKKKQRKIKEEYFSVVTASTKLATVLISKS